MAVTSFKLGNRKYVIVPEPEYRKLAPRKNGVARPVRRRRLSRAELDRIDGEAALKALADPYRIKHEDLMRELGL